MDQNTLFFFNGHPEALPLYRAYEERLLAELEGVIIQPQKSQITLKNRRVFGAVSFLAARKAKDRPDPYITVTLGLNRREGSPRVDQASEPYPGRWTHHLVIGSVEEIDDELMAWVREAAAFSAAIEIEPLIASASGRMARELQAILGPERKIPPEADPYALLNRRKGAQLPRFFVTCGEQDALYQENVRFVKALEERGADVRFEHWEGDHRWEVWDKSVEMALEEFFPAGKK